jgi:hypothetical protein
LHRVFALLGKLTLSACPKSPLKVRPPNAGSRSQPQSRIVVCELSRNHTPTDRGVVQAILRDTTANLALHRRKRPRSCSAPFGASAISARRCGGCTMPAPLLLKLGSGAIGNVNAPGLR